MTLTRLFQGGGELNTINEFSNYPNNDFGSSDMSISATAPRTGSRSLLASGSGQRPRGYAFTATTIVSSFFVRHNGFFSTNRQPAICVIPTSFATATVFYWDEATGDLRLRVNNSTVDSVSAAAVGFSTVNTYYNIGIFYHADATNGAISVYKDGVKILEYTGNTGTTIGGLYVGGGVGATGAWASAAYFDDLYIDDATGESDAPPTTLRFDWQIADGAGAHTDLTPNTGANYAAVDDTTPDDDATYVYAAASGVKDGYTTSDITVPAAHRVVARIPVAWARRTDAGTASQWKLGSRSSGGTEVLGSAQTPNTSYGILWERQTTEPGGADWDETKVNAAQVLIESAGAF